MQGSCALGNTRFGSALDCSHARITCSYLLILDGSRGGGTSPPPKNFQSNRANPDADIAFLPEAAARVAQFGSSFPEWTKAHPHVPAELVGREISSSQICACEGMELDAFAATCYALPVLVSLLATRVAYVLFRPPARSSAASAQCLIVLGSGGHTAEMMNVVTALQKDRFVPRFYVAALTDNMSLQKA